MTKRKLIGALIAGIALGFSASPLAAFAAGITNGLKGINLQGVGTGKLTLLDCPPHSTAQLGLETAIALRATAL